MIGVLVVVFREVLEAGLVIGVVLAATRGIARRGLWIGLGVGGGVIGAGVVAFFAAEIANVFQGSGQELLNATVLFVAVGMLGWHNAWMASHGRTLARQLKELGRDVVEGRRPLTALAIVCGVAILREGSEVVLFLFGIVAGGSASSFDLLLGGVAGILSGAAVSALLYLGLIAIPLRYLFGTLTALITLLAAGLAAQAVDFLQQAGWLQIGSAPLWNTSRILSQDGPLGNVLHILIGYVDRPTGSELAAYVLVVLAMAALVRFARPADINAGAPARS